MSETVTPEQIAELRYQASELQAMAEAFRPNPGDGEVIRIPARMCARLAEALGATAQALLNIVEKQPK